MTTAVSASWAGRGGTGGSYPPAWDGRVSVGIHRQGAGYPQDLPVSRETEHQDGTVNQVEPARSRVAIPATAGGPNGGRSGAARGATRYDDSTPLARAVEQQLLVRQARRPGLCAAPPRPHPGDGRGQPEGRGRQDHHGGQHGRRPGPARPPGAGHRPRPPGQRLHGARRSTTTAARPRPTTCWSTARRWPTWCSRTPTCANLFVAPATIDLAGAEIELVSVVARESRLRKAIAAHPLVGARRGPLRLRADRLPTLAGPAHAERAGRRRGDADPDPGGVLRARGPRPAARDRGDGAHAPQPGARGEHDPAHDVRLADQPGRRRGRRGARALLRPGAQDRDPALGAGLGGAELRPERDDLRPRLARRAELSRGRTRAGAPWRRHDEADPATADLGGSR